MFSQIKKTHWKEQLEILKNFLMQWYGPFDVDCRNIQNEIDEIPIPAPLKEFYKFIDKRINIVSSMNELVAPSDLKFENNDFVFYIESQGVYIWATNNEDKDPKVIGRFNDEGEIWREEEERLSGFLCQLCFFEAIMGASYGASVSWLSKEELVLLLRHWKPLPFGSWQWPVYPTKFFYTAEALAIISPNEEGFTFKCGAQQSVNLQFMNKFVRKGWEYVSF